MGLLDFLSLNGKNAPDLAPGLYCYYGAGGRPDHYGAGAV